MKAGIVLSKLIENDMTNFDPQKMKYIHSENNSMCIDIKHTLKSCEIEKNY